MADIRFTRTDAGLCASQSHRMEQVPGVSHEIMLTTCQREARANVYVVRFPSSIVQMRTVRTITCY